MKVTHLVELRHGRIPSSAIHITPCSSSTQIPSERKRSWSLHPKEASSSEDTQRPIPLGFLPVTTPQPRAGRSKKVDGKSNSKPAAGPTGTGFPQREIYLVLDKMGPLLKTRFSQAPHSSPTFPALPVPESDPDSRQMSRASPLFSVTQIHVTEQGLTDSFKPGRPAEVSRNTAM